MTRKPRDGWADFHECSPVPWSLCFSKHNTRGACRSLRAHVSRHDDSPFSLPVATSVCRPYPPMGSRGHRGTLAPGGSLAFSPDTVRSQLSSTPSPASCCLLGLGKTRGSCEDGRRSEGDPAEWGRMSLEKASQPATDNPSTHVSSAWTETSRPWAVPQRSTGACHRAPRPPQIFWKER